MNIILAVTGSISAYRALDICRGLTKEGHAVRIVFTRSAEEFLNYKTFYYLGAQKVYRSHDDFNPEQDTIHHVLHIELVKWCDKLIIAPASAHTIAKLAQGLCDDLLSSIFLALGSKTCALFPAMNTNMLNHPHTQENLKKLKKLSHVFIHPSMEGELACGDIGEGKLPKPELISEIIPLITNATTKKTVMITTGATVAPIDPIRFVTNPASGLTGYELAKTYLRQGAKVILIYGHHPHEKIQFLKHLPNITLIQAKTTREMLETVSEHFGDVDIYISTAAISDIEFKTSSEKIKKKNIFDSLSTTVAPDILATVLAKKTHQKIVGFAAETDCSAEVLKEKWTRKPVDLLIGNQVSNGVLQAQKGFAAHANEYFMVQEGQVVAHHHFSKKELAEYIADTIHD